MGVAEVVVGVAVSVGREGCVVAVVADVVVVVWL